LKKYWPETPIDNGVTGQQETLPQHTSLKKKGLGGFLKKSPSIPLFQRGKQTFTLDIT